MNITELKLVQFFINKKLQHLLLTDKTDFRWGCLLSRYSPKEKPEYGAETAQTQSCEPGF